jgi:hypothetical protein
MISLTALVEGLDGPFVTPRWGVRNTNVEGRWRRTKSKILAIACFAIASVVVLPMNVCAWNLNPSAWTNQTSYTIGDPVLIYVEWSVTVPQNWEHEYCYVNLNPHPVGSIYSPMYDGDYTVGSGPSGVVSVYCSGTDGNAYYAWDSNMGWEATWIVDVYIVAYDSSQSEGDRWINDELTTNTFTLSPP